MHDIRLVRDQLDLLREGMRRRGKLAELGPLLDRAESLERDRRAAITELEAQQARRNRVTQEVAQRRKAGEDATALIAESRAIGDAIASLDARRLETESAVQQMLYELPNITLPEVPEGGEDANTPAPDDDAATPPAENAPANPAPAAPAN